VIALYVFSVCIQSLPPHPCVDTHQSGDEIFLEQFDPDQAIWNEGERRDSATVSGHAWVRPESAYRPMFFKLRIPAFAGMTTLSASFIE